MSNIKCQISKRDKTNQFVIGADEFSIGERGARLLDKRGFLKLEIRNFYPGFTIPELIITIGIFIILASLATISVLSVKQRTSLDTSVNILIGDLKQQQLKAMVGDTEGRGTRDDYSIHADGDTYTLYHGATYTPGAAGNFTVTLGDNVSFSATSDMVFQRRSGEVSGGATSLTLGEGTTGTQRTIIINRYGVVTSVN